MLDEIETAGDSDVIPGPVFSTDANTPPSSILPIGAALGRFVITGFVGQGGWAESILPATPN
jgi:hypothetical protein